MSRAAPSSGQWPGWSPWMFRFFTLLFLFLGVGFIIQSIHDRNLNAKFDGPVVRVLGMVDDVVQMEGVTTTKGTSHGTHRIAYHFDAPDGRHKAGIGATVATCDSLHPGDPVTVKYLAGDPNTSRLDLPREDASHRQEVWIDLAAGIGQLILAAIFIRKWLQG